MEMNNKLFKNFLPDEENTDRINFTKQRIIYSEMLSSEECLYFSKYYFEKPYSYYNDRTFDYVINYFSTINVNDINILNILRYHMNDINVCLRTIRLVNEYCETEESISGMDDVLVIKMIDDIYNVNYLKLAEYVFSPLCIIIAKIMRFERGVGFDDLKLFDAVNEINKYSTNVVTKNYDAVIRNAIAHGGVEYDSNVVIFEDSKGHRREYLNFQFLYTFDEFMDDCNGMVYALELVLLKNNLLLESVPSEIVHRLLESSVNSNKWMVNLILKSKYIGGRQLLIYVKCLTNDMLIIQYNSFLTAVYAESISKGYDRYFITMRDDYDRVGWASFIGNELAKARKESDVSFDSYKNAVETTGIFKLGMKKYTKLYRIVNTFVPMAFKNYVYNIRIVWNKTYGLKIVYRGIKQHKTSGKRIINGSVVVRGVEKEISMHVIKENLGRIYRGAKKHAVNSKGEERVKNHPLGYMRLSVFDKDYRLRKLGSYGLGESLICTIVVNVGSKIKNIDIKGSRIEKVGKYRIAWNSAWLEKQGIE